MRDFFSILLSFDFFIVSLQSVFFNKQTKLCGFILLS